MVTLKNFDMVYFQKNCIVKQKFQAFQFWNCACDSSKGKIPL